MLRLSRSINTAVRLYQRIKQLVDPRSFRAFLLTIQNETTQPSVVTGTARIAKQSWVSIVFDFSVHGGTLNVAVSTQVTRAVEYATQQRMPLVVITTTGGVRIQEGMVE